MLAEAAICSQRLDWRDVVSLGKPRLSSMVVFTTAVGMRLAPQTCPWPRLGLILLATFLVVAAANALNCYYERDVDAQMRRTRGRPLPAGRLDPGQVLCGGLAVGGLAIATLYRVANPLTALLAFLAFALYVWVYTPMKRYSWWAVWVGALPGAIPPLMGWAAITGTLPIAAWPLFVLMCVWQLPHFFAIAVALQEDYGRGGLHILPQVYGPRATVAWTVATGICTWAVSLWPWGAGLVGPRAGFVACLGGAAFVLLTLSGFARPLIPWARSVFIASIFYLVLLLTLLLSGAPPSA